MISLKSTHHRVSLWGYAMRCVSVGCSRRGGPRWPWSPHCCGKQLRVNWRETLGGTGPGCCWGAAGFRPQQNPRVPGLLFSSVSRSTAVRGGQEYLEPDSKIQYFLFRTAKPESYYIDIKWIISEKKKIFYGVLPMVRWNKLKLNFYLLCRFINN